MTACSTGGAHQHLRLTDTYLVDSGQLVSYTTLECAQSPLHAQLLGMCHSSALESFWGWDGKQQKQNMSIFNSQHYFSSNLQI